MAILTLRDASGGWNATDPAIHLGDTQVTAAVNVTWDRASLCRKRSGCTAVSGTGLPSQGIVCLFRHIPAPTGTSVYGEDQARLLAFTHQGELWVKLAGSVYPTWQRATATDTIYTTYLADAVAVSFNGKVFLAYQTPFDRLHVLDGWSLRRTGLASPTAAPPSPVNYPFVGAYPATPHWYRMAWAVYSGSTVLRRSNLSPSVAFTGSGAALGVVVYPPTPAPGEGETHWEVYASTDNAYFYRIATAPVSDLFTSHSVLPTDFSDSPLAADAGTYTALPSGRTLCVDENRLLVGGSWTLGSSTVYWTPVLGSEGAGDDERYVTTTSVKNYLVLDEQQGGGVVAFAHLGTSVLVFKLSRLYRLIRTGQVTSPYTPLTVSTTVGAVRQATVVEGEMPTGEPAVYWLSQDGPYRFGGVGLEYLGHPLEGHWRTLTTGWEASAWGLYYRAQHQVWWWVDGAVLVYDVRRGAWAKYTGTLATAVCGVCAGEDHATVTDKVTLALKPVVSLSATSAVLARADDGTTDHDDAYQAYLTTRAIQPLAMGNSGVTEVQVVADGGGDLWVTLSGDSGLDERSVGISLDAEASETLVARKAEGLEMTACQWVQVTVGDAAASSTAWAVHQVALKLRQEEIR